ncbi:MAG: excinuclease ABC subunit UvrC [Clostridia bacterium]|nr:excinuclease ABC subunit UvrC [Clostridia bacterium]
MQSVDLQTKLKNLPEEPGVYLMYDADGNLLYVGKAKNLKNRVRQYFFASTNKTEKVLAMLSHVDTFRYVITGTETDALSLENTLIKKHTPPYNILLKDDKQYPYVKVDLTAKFPKLVPTRRFVRDKCKYFGPITYGGIKSVMEVLSHAFPTVTCNLNFDKLPKNFRPCLNYHIGKCCGPCIGAVSKEEYRKVIDKAVRFLQGDDAEVVQILTEKMMQASDKMQYEQALSYKKLLEVVQKMGEKRLVVLKQVVNYDMFAIASNGKNAVVNHMMVRGGKVTFSDNFAVTDAGIDEAQTLQSFLTEYCPTVDLSGELYVNLPLPDADAVAGLLATKCKSRVTIAHPQRGQKRKLVDMSYRNAVEYLTKSQTEIDRKYNTTVGAVHQLKELLGLKQLPKRIECYDISNISGVDKVASMVVFTNGQRDSGQYRRFQIKTVQGANDFASMKETLVRRLTHVKDEDARFGAKPDLIVVDGGLGQLDYARQAMEQTGVHVPLVSLAKREELVYTLHNNQPIFLPRNSYALNLLINLRDEAHRFAITYFRKLHGKNSLKTILGEIDGIGPKRQMALYRFFKNIDAIKDATIDQLKQVKGMTAASAQKVYDYFHVASPKGENND